MKLHDPVMTYPVTCDASSADEEAPVRPGCRRRSNRDAKSRTDKGECGCAVKRAHRKIYRVKRRYVAGRCVSGMGVAKVT
jgi:hypothetical protein